VERQDERLLLSFATELVFWPCGQALLHGGSIELENEHRVKEADESGNVAGAAAKEGGSMALIGCQIFYSLDTPEVMTVSKSYIRGPRATLPPFQR